MRHAPILAVIAVVLASIACGSEPAAKGPHTNKYVTELALTQVEADLGKGAIVITPVDTNDDDEGCTVNTLVFKSCMVAADEPSELHVHSTLCELHPDRPADVRYFVECRPASANFVPPAEIPHCPGHDSKF